MKEPVVTPYKWWWSVDYEKEDGEYFLLFRRRERAEEFMQALLRGASKDEIFDLALARLR